MTCVYIGENRLLLKTTIGSRMVVPSQDLSVTTELALNGILEPPLTHFFLNEVKQGQTAVDVGANVGYFSVILGYLVGSEGRLVCYEPNPAAVRFLLDNLSINYVRDRATVHAKAAYDTETRLKFHSSQRFLGNSSIHPHDAHYFERFTDEIEVLEVDAEPLRLTLEALGSIDWFKIDIEGGEYHAFMGVREMIEAGHIRNVVFELNRPMMQDNYDDFCRLLFHWQSLGREFFVLDAEGHTVPANLASLLAMGTYPYILMR